nr:serine/arginine repetitive matrix protein 3-like [Aegilops tauschii subsp. strangulata]
MAPPRPDEPVADSKEDGGSSPESDTDEPPPERPAVAARRSDLHQAAAAPLQTTPLRGQDRPRPPPRAARRHPGAGSRRIGLDPRLHATAQIGNPAAATPQTSPPLDVASPPGNPAAELRACRRAASPAKARRPHSTGRLAPAAEHGGGGGEARRRPHKPGFADGVAGRRRGRRAEEREVGSRRIGFPPVSRESDTGGEGTVFPT